MGGHRRLDLFRPARQEPADHREPSDRGGAARDVAAARIGDPCDTFGGATGEEKARAFDVYGYAFLTQRR